MRIDKVLANMGYGTRKEVKKLLKTGVVRADGVPLKHGKEHVDPYEQEITIYGELVEYREHIYLMMNKPQGVISATEDPNEHTVIDILEPEDQVFEPFPVGRLDKDTEGFLLITNDGKLAHQLLSPKKGVGKRYFAHIEGVVTEADKDSFLEGVELDDGYVTKPAQLTILESGEESIIELVITEGKFHQVKRMFESVGKQVTYLKRLSMAGMELDEDLEPGEYRELNDEEIEFLQQAQNKKES
ncbi:RNA pseudouridine synthase [Pontibacillus halophilus JSM 076056 = DSM 19796]|uniref:Pseudouridine synthase n=1 Tax=Pontibacillus halophilus JSM 076056 = DSM 19796 TaxID=1385510 RepID=A0A0A5GDZ9_9BACI|nr:pseudouridine synthase [Pontibacillus halophilus]KGX89428.1 RNA pseudouridine synthase [Pontibacillus halophilus JSM 076056 = DSM 19796]